MTYQMPSYVTQALANSGLTTKEQVAAKSDEDLLRIPRIGQSALLDIKQWLNGHRPEPEPSVDKALLEAWIAELTAAQDKCPATAKGYREAGVLAFTLGTLKGLLL